MKSKAGKTLYIYEREREREREGGAEGRGVEKQLSQFLCC